MQEFVTSGEGEKLLGTNRQRFFYYVSQGRITRKDGETPRKSLYLKSDILKLKEEIGISNKREADLPLIIDWVKPLDIPKTIALDMIVYDENIVGDYKLYLSWIKRNPHLSLAAFDEKREKVYAYLALLPLEESVILSVLRGEREETSITAEEIKTYDKEGEYDLLVESIVAHPDHPEAIGLIMNYISSYWCEQWPKRKLHYIYAQTVSDQGIYLVQRLFFGPMLGYPDNAYVLDMQRKSFSKVVRQYQDCIANKTTT